MEVARDKFSDIKVCFFIFSLFVFLQDIISVDPCHKFTWCLDACIREKNVDIKRSRELQVPTTIHILSSQP